MPAPIAGRMPQQPRLLIAGGVTAAVILLWMIYGPSWMTVRRLTAQWSQMKGQVTESRRILDWMREAGLSPLPKTGAFSGILIQLNTLARTHEVELLQVAPGAGRPSEPAPLVLVPVELALEGGYRSIGEFLGGLRQTPSLGVVQLKRLAIERQERLLPRLRAQVTLEWALMDSSDRDD